MPKRHYSRSKTTYEVHGNEIRGDMFKPKKSKRGGYPAVIFLHGRDEGREEYKEFAKALAKKKIASFTFDFRGHGDSEGVLGKQTIRDGLKDAKAAYDILLEDEEINSDKIGVFGLGFGGYISTLLSKETDLKSIVLASPAIYKDEWMDLMYRNFPLKDVKQFRSKINFVEIRSVKAIRKFTGSLFVLGGKDDEFVPETVIKAYYDNAINAKKKDIKFIKEAGHYFKGEKVRKKLMKKVVKWFSKKL